MVFANDYKHLEGKILLVLFDGVDFGFNILETKLKNVLVEKCPYTGEIFFTVLELVITEYMSSAGFVYKTIAYKKGHSFTACSRVVDGIVEDFIN